jgi:monofunctional biosynthetic peptidoglycan transglycosylase
VPHKEVLLHDFRGQDEAARWRKVNDVVMGGLSQSEMVFTSRDTAIFRGRVSLENYGGFASVRTTPQDYDVGGDEGLVVRVKGDGHRFRLRLRTNDRFDGPAYQVDFDTVADAWITVRAPFSAFVPTFRGRPLRDAPPLDSAQIRQIGFLIADKQAGPFQLEIDWISAYKDTP